MTETLFVNRLGLIILIPSYGPRLTLLLAEDPEHAYPSGGWTQIARPRRGPGTDFQGPEDAESLSLSLAVDTRMMDVGMREALVVLRKMRRPHSDHAEPPKIKVFCDTIPLVRETRWVMQSLTFGAQVVRDGLLVRQAVAVGLERYQPFDEIDRVRPRRSRNRNNQRKVRVVKTRPNDTLRAIAVRELGDSGAWKSLQRWNVNLRQKNPDEPLRAGVKVSLGGPDAATAAFRLGAELGEDLLDT